MLVKGVPGDYDPTNTDRIDSCISFNINVYAFLNGVHILYIWL